MTEIQDAVIPLALEGKDILAAAKTGSGKTMAFLVPILECLLRENWTLSDGLGALIITPTRELALQTFEVLRRIGVLHSFSAGLIIGGKNLAEEQTKISRMNILVCSPGRLLQHMDQTVGFDTHNIKMLVLDEADKILELGFSNTVNAILENLPKKRQTMLFSATQNASVKDLARLSLKNPVSIHVHDMDETSTPLCLAQCYMVCDLKNKFDLLYSFVRTHIKSKMLVFLSSCKQVRFYYEAFCKLQPGLPVLALHGQQSQMKRIGIFKDFNGKTNALLLATDIAARGLDFPAVDWVIQSDCPESVSSYIHRVGRSARYESSGNALLLLLPSEEPVMIEALTKAKVPIAKMEPNTSKLVSVASKLASICSQYKEIKYLAQKAIVSYMRSIFLQSNKDVFKVALLDPEEMAASFGLSSAPFLKLVKQSNHKNVNKDLLKIQQEQQVTEKKESSDSDFDHATSSDRRGDTTTLCPEVPQHIPGSLTEDEESFLVKKSQGRHMESDMQAASMKDSSLSRVAKKRRKEAVKLAGKYNDHFVFDETGLAKSSYGLVPEVSLSNLDFKEAASQHMESSRQSLQVADIQDKLLAKEKRRIKRLKLNKKKKLIFKDFEGSPQSSLPLVEDQDTDPASSSDESATKGVGLKPTLEDAEKVAMTLLRNNSFL